MITGEKTFTLFPPCDAPFLYSQQVETRKYVLKKSEEEKSDSERLLKSDLLLTKEGCPSDSISWIPIDPDSDEGVDRTRYPNFHLAHPIRVTVKAGEVS